MITDPLFYLVAIPALIYVGVSKAGFLSGTGFIGVPLMALVISPIQAAAVMLPILVAMDMAGLQLFWRQAAWRHVWLLLPAAFLGVIIGSLTARWIDEAMVKILVGLVALLFSLDYYVKWRPHHRPGKWMAGILGMLCGFTSFVAHAGGPPASMYLLPQKLDKLLYAGTMVWFFAFLNAFKLIPYALLGQLDRTNLSTALLLLPVAPLSMWLGLHLVKRVPTAPFYRITYACVLIAGLKLLWDGLRALS